MNGARAGASEMGMTVPSGTGSPVQSSNGLAPASQVHSAQSW